MQIRKSRENGLILAISLGNQSKKVLLGKLALMEGMYAWWKSSTPLINNSPERLVWINQCVFSHFGAEERPIINMDGWVLSKQALFLPIPSWIKQRSTKAEWGSKLLLSSALTSSLLGRENSLWRPFFFVRDKPFNLFWSSGHTPETVAKLSCKAFIRYLDQLNHSVWKSL